MLWSGMIRPADAVTKLSRGDIPPTYAQFLEQGARAGARIGTLEFQLGTAPADRLVRAVDAPPPAAGIDPKPVRPRAGQPGMEGDRQCPQPEGDISRSALHNFALTILGISKRGRAVNVGGPVPTRHVIQHDTKSRT